MPAHTLPRYVMLSAAGLNLCLIALQIVLYRHLTAMPNSTRFILEPIIGLVACATFVLIVTRSKPRTAEVIRPASILGIIAGVLLVIHMSLENFGNRIGENGSITLGFMAATFLAWAIAGFLAKVKTSQTPLALRSAILCAVISVLIAVTFGFLLMFVGIPSPKYVSSWPEFKQSGWTDAHAFAIASSFEAAFTHLLAALILGTFLGLVSAALASLFSKHQGTPR